MGGYNRSMARGWESKSVEAQQESAASEQSLGRPRLTREQADRLREKESLQLSLRNVLKQLEGSSSSQRRDMLERAKSDLERKIEKLSVP
jgi:hypothetical protein